MKHFNVNLQFDQTRSKNSLSQNNEETSEKFATQKNCHFVVNYFFHLFTFNEVTR